MSQVSTAAATTPRIALSSGNDHEPVVDQSGASAEMIANNSRLGATLPREETGDVMSGAVVPPGAEGTPSSTPRKKRSRMSNNGDESGMASSSDEEEDEDEEEEYLDEQDEEDRIIQNGGIGIPIGEVGCLGCLFQSSVLIGCRDQTQDGIPRPLLSELSPHDFGRKCLVLDLDETLVHSSFKVRQTIGFARFSTEFVGPVQMIHSADYIVPVEIENQNHNVYVIKRPGVDEVCFGLSILLLDNLLTGTWTVLEADGRDI